MTYSLSLHRSMERGEFKPLNLKRTAIKPSTAQSSAPVASAATRKVRLPIFKQPSA
ncbi:hypothetical protein [Pseudophaeobacter arcticus]|uniref:hypothetical protein n=1 Tax=Pseudophaeobacter arcticus TaxID=385492 RepID=UPI0012B66A2A|nr:hypothetical protein [Pseudophaeobacter arcticus]